ncbi:MAG: iron-sulfur protein, partial [Acidimicrobiaceae bacterium]|nr:iron-sulfur protein [Acidimicrobiaceae bacterium]
PRPEQAVIGAVRLAIGITGFGAEAFRIAADGLPDHERWSFIGYPLATLVDGSGPVAGLHQAWWAGHGIAFTALPVLLPRTR